MAIESKGITLHLVSISKAIQAQSAPNLKDFKIMKALKTVTHIDLLY